MLPINNIHIGGVDPLLGGATNYSINDRIAEVSQLKALLNQKEQSLEQIKAQMTQNTQQLSKAPVWDEIDKEIQGLSDVEYEFVSKNQEFIDSSNNIATLLQGAYMEMMRPVLEGSPKGKDALENHLTLVRRLKKAASAESNKQMADFQEYTQKYADMTYADYLKMKNGTLKSNQS